LLEPVRDGPARRPERPVSRCVRQTTPIPTATASSRRRRV
jgi:hypothetical protein